MFVHRIEAFRGLNQFNRFFFAARFPLCSIHTTAIIHYIMRAEIQIHYIIDLFCSIKPMPKRPPYKITPTPKPKSLHTVPSAPQHNSFSFFLSWWAEHSTYDRPCRDQSMEKEAEKRIKNMRKCEHGKLDFLLVFKLKLHSSVCAFSEKLQSAREKFVLWTNGEEEGGKSRISRLPSVSSAI